jgi:uncharacterized protein (TIGR02001 family)
VADLHPRRCALARAVLSLLLFAAGTACAANWPSDFTYGGNLAVTSDDIYRGLSESDGEGALQVDLHAAAGGTFLGAWVSTRKRSLYPYADYDVEVYLGHRFDLSSTWGATLDARSHYFVAGAQPTSADYQELSGSLTYLDRWTLSLTAIPNAVRYWYYARLTRGPAWVAETSGQWLIAGGFFVTAGAGYYYSTGTAPAYPEPVAAPPGMEPAAPSLGGYAYGNAGFAYEYRRWRLDVGYFLTQPKAQALSPYPSANERFAGTLTWRF